MTRAIFVAMLLSASTPARAQAPEPSNADKAAALFDEGKRHFDIAEYTAAIASWKQAYLLSSEPLLLFNIGQAYRLAGNCAEANRFYLNYKRLVPKPANAVELDAAMTKCAGVEPATGESDTTPVETKPPEPKPPQPMPPAPTPVPAPAVTKSVTMTDEGAGLRTTGFVVGGAGIALGAAAVVFALEASSASDLVQSQPNRTTWAGSLPGEQSSGQRDQTLSRVFGIAGIAAIGTGTVLWFLGHQRASTTQVGVAVVPGRTEVTLSCAF